MANFEKSLESGVRLKITKHLDDVVDMGCNADVDAMMQVICEVIDRDYDFDCY